MTEAQKELYARTEARMRRLGKENPADCILSLAEEVEYYRKKIKRMQELIDKLDITKTLYEQDIEDWKKLAESKAEEIYPEFMRDYKCALEELEGCYEELKELREERDTLRAQRDALLKGGRTNGT